MVRSFNQLRNKKGFTLIELIVVLAVLAIIMAIAVPRFTGVQEKAKVDADYSTGAMIAKAAEFYVAQNEDAVESFGVSVLKLSDFEFQSSKIKDLTVDKVSCKWDKDVGTISVEVGDGVGEPFQIYPIPTTRDLEVSVIEP